MSRPNDDVIDLIARELREPVRVDPALDARVMSAVRVLHGRGRAWAWLTRPRPVALSPLGGLALAAGLATIVVLAGLAGRDRARHERLVIERGGGQARPGSHVVSAEASAAPHDVQFVLVAPRASRVSVVGDFNDWDSAATPLQQMASPGVWMVTVPLQPGRYRYTFIVDGTKWTPDPAAPSAPEDDFGEPSSVITVAERSS